MYSASCRGRSVRSIASSCGAAAGAIRRSVSIIACSSWRSTLGLTSERLHGRQRLVGERAHRLRDGGGGLIETPVDHAGHFEHGVDEIARTHARHREAHPLRAVLDAIAHLAVFLVEQLLHVVAVVFRAGYVVRKLAAQC